MHRLRSLLLAGLAFVVPATANAAVITYSTPVNSTLDGQPIAASATFTTTDGALALLLENLSIDPVSIIQNISGIQFSLTDATSGSLISSAGTPRTVAQDGTFIDAPMSRTDWLFSFNAGAFALSALGADGPDETIIGAPGGANTYSNAKGSIAGNNPHNPFLARDATFKLAALGVTEQSRISNVVLFFGTEPNGVSAVCNDGCPPVATTVPEPASLVLLGTGLLGLVQVQRRRRRSSSDVGLAHQPIH